MYICCRVKNLSKIWPFLSQTSGQGCQKSVQDFVCLSCANFKVFGGIQQNTNSVYGVRNLFWTSWGVKKGGFEKTSACFVFVFFMLHKAKEKRSKTLKRKTSKTAQKNCVLGVVVKRNYVLC